MFTRGGAFQWAEYLRLDGLKSSFLNRPELKALKEQSSVFESILFKTFRMV